MHIRQFTKDYRLPLQATALFIIIVLLMLLLRFYEQSVLAGVLDSGSNKSRDYASLLSVDKNDDLKKNDVNEAANPEATVTDKPVSSSTASAPLTISPSGGGGNSPTSSTGTSTPPAPSPGGTTPPAPPPPAEPPPPPAEPFTASIEDIGLESQHQICETSLTSLNKCYKVYNFKGEIKTLNGPGEVGYGWRSSLSSANEDGKFSVGSGETFTPLGKVIKLACDQPLQFGVRLIIRSPNSVQSDTVNVSHKCELIAR